MTANSDPKERNELALKQEHVLQELDLDTLDTVSGGTTCTFYLRRNGSVRKIVCNYD